MTRIFPSVVRHSIPNCSGVVSVVNVLTRHFIRPNARICSLNYSLNTTALSIHHGVRRSGYGVVTVSGSPTVVRHYHHRVSTCGTPAPMSIVRNSVHSVTVRGTSVIILGFALRFLRPSRHRTLLSGVCRKLGPNNTLILSRGFDFRSTGINRLLFGVRRSFGHTGNCDRLRVDRGHDVLRGIVLASSIRARGTHLRGTNFRRDRL